MLSQHPANLLLRSVIEIVGLISVAQWGWERSTSWPRILFAIGLPLLFALLWIGLAAPGESGWNRRVLIPVSGRVRLVIEVVLFGLTFGLMLNSGRVALGIAFALAFLLHYFWSTDRIVWLFKN